MQQPSRQNSAKRKHSDLSAESNDFGMPWSLNSTHVILILVDLEVAVILCAYFFLTIWLFNIAMENTPFIDDFPSKSSIYSGFSMAMLNNQRVF